MRAKDRGVVTGAGRVQRVDERQQLGRRHQQVASGLAAAGVAIRVRRPLRREERATGTGVECLLADADTQRAGKDIPSFIVAVMHMQRRDPFPVRFAAVAPLDDHDQLTELWNRRRFQEELDRQIARGRRSGESAAVLMIDLDGFKQINDTHGHTTGDELLKRIAQALRERLRSTDSVARLGGDEFACS